MEVYAANAVDRGKRTRRNDHATPMDTYVAEPGPSNSQQQVQVPGAPNGIPQGILYGMSHGAPPGVPPGVLPDANPGVPIQVPNHETPHATVNPPSSAVSPAQNTNSNGTTIPTNSQTLPKKKRVYKPVRYLPITVRRNNVWDVLAKSDAGLTVSEWLSIDKQAARDVIDGLRTLRSRKKKITQEGQNKQTIVGVPIPKPTRGVKRSAQRISNIEHLDSSSGGAHGPFGSSGPSGPSDPSGPNSNSNGPSPIFGVNNNNSIQATLGDEELWEDSGYSTNDVLTSLGDVSDEESIVSSTTTTTDYSNSTDVYSLVNYPYSLHRMRVSAPLKAPVSVNGIVFECTFDSGASVSVMNEELAQRLGLEYNGDQIHLIGFDSMQREPCNIAVNVPFRVAGHLRSEHVCIQRNRRANQKDYCILGMTWFRAYGVTVDLHNNIISFPASVRRDVNGELIVDPNGARVELQGYSTHEDVSSPMVDFSTRRIKQNEVLAISIIKTDLTPVVNEINNKNALNTYTEDIVDIAEDSESHGDDTNGEGSLCLEDVPDYLKKLIKDKADCFVEISGLGRVDMIEHEIPIAPGSTPIKSKPFRLSWEEQDKLAQEISEMLNLGLIRPSKGTWSSPCFFVKKKDGSLRLVIDYRRLNRMTIKDNFPLPIIDTLLDSLAGAKVYSTLDAASGYWQVPMEIDSIERTGFITPQGTYEFQVMPFGLTSAPATFQRMMTNLLGEYIGKFVHVFIDDVICYSQTPEEHVQHLELIFDKCKQHNLRLKFKKCKFGAPKVEYLGHEISGDGITPNTHNLDKILKFRTPRNADDIRSFLGTTGYYRRFINNYAMVSAPLTRLLKKNVKFQWSEAQEDAYQYLKKALISAPLLVYPDKNQIQILTTDASSKGIAAILSQSPDGRSEDERVISYNSRTLRAAEKNYATVHLEALAIVWGINKYRHYLLGRRFILRTDNSALTFVLEPSRPSPKLARWATTLMEYDYQVEHHPGARNPADSLSRLLLKED
ncbi:hypothetical protein G6F62_007014 [Rhizopus arrhizus]|nr:hypothetical protein G6F62_007014 [Rhizopus arrhizus]